MFNFFKIDTNDDFNEEYFDLKELKINRIKAWVILGIVTLIIVWMSIFELDIASHSMGEVIPATKIKPIQHLEGGIVRNIYVKEGQIVKKGEVLVDLEMIFAQSDLASVNSQIINLEIKRARLLAQLNNNNLINISKEISDNYPEKIKAANKILTNYNNKIITVKKTQEFKIKQQEAQLIELRVRLKNLSEKLIIMNKQMNINAKLIKKGLANEYERLILQKEKHEITGSIKEINASILKIETILSQEKSILKNLVVTEKETLNLELEDTQNKFTELNEQVLKFEDKDKRLLIKSPIDGTVLSLNVFTKGAVVNPGGTMLNLVPSNDPLLIETKLEVGDVGLVKVGQDARIQLMSSSARGFQAITGKVVYISADKIVNKDDIPYYLVKIRPSEFYFLKNKVKFSLIPGVRVQASILLGKRTIIDYLLTPFQDIKNNALSET